jgi:hypothetical protein
LSLTDRIQSGGANADRNRFALSYGPFPTARKAHFDHRETDAAMFHGGPPLTFNYALSVSSGVEAIDAPAITNFKAALFLALIAKQAPLPGEADRGNEGKTGGERYITRWPVNGLALMSEDLHAI